VKSSGTTTKKGEELRALDFLHLLFDEKKYKREGKLFFDMGIVNDDNEKDIMRT
jgi:hypothetical protein